MSGYGDIGVKNLTIQGVKKMQKTNQKVHTNFLVMKFIVMMKFNIYVYSNYTIYPKFSSFDVTKHNFNTYLGLAFASLVALTGNLILQHQI